MSHDSNVTRFFSAGLCRAISHCVTRHSSARYSSAHSTCCLGCPLPRRVQGGRLSLLSRVPPSCFPPSRHSSPHCTRPALMFPALTLADRPYAAVRGRTRPYAALLLLTWPYPAKLGRARSLHWMRADPDCGTALDPSIERRAPLSLSPPAAPSRSGKHSCSCACSCEDAGSGLLSRCYLPPAAS